MIGEEEEGGGIQYIKEAGNSRKMREMINDNESGRRGLKRRGEVGGGGKGETRN